MKNTLLITIASLVIIEANGGWPHYGPGIGNGRRNNQGPAWSYPQQMNQNTFGSDVEWVCQNPRTNDMIIATDNTQRQHPGRGSWWQWQNVPSEHHHHHQNPGNYWTQPVIVVQQESTRTNGNELSFTTPPTIPETHGNNDDSNNNNNNNQPLTTPNYHGGEGLIDIRLGN